MNSLEETKSLKLADGRKATLLDDDAISIEISTSDTFLSSTPIPYPNAGYGGGSIALACGRRFLLFSYYSGQSEEAFELFEVGDQLVRVFSSG